MKHDVSSLQTPFARLSERLDAQHAQMLSVRTELLLAEQHALVARAQVHVLAQIAGATLGWLLAGGGREAHLGAERLLNEIVHEVEATPDVPAVLIEATRSAVKIVREAAEPLIYAAKAAPAAVKPDAASTKP